MKKSNIISLILCAVAFVIMVFYMLFVDGEQVYEALAKIKGVFLLAAALCMCVYWVLEASVLNMVIKAVHPAIKFRYSLSVSMIGQYFNCVTPFASGGQPMQAYYLSRYKVPLGSGMTALLSKFIIYQFTLTIYCLFMLFLRIHYFGAELGALKILTVVGFIINFAVILALLTLALFKNLAFNIAHFILKILSKIKLVKNYERKLDFITEEAELYRKNFLFLRRQPVLMLKMFALTVLQLTAYFSISFVIYKGFGLSGSDYLTIIACQSFVLMISSFFPLPGALGAAEGSYGAFFGGIFGTLVTFSMFVWRFLTFYVPLILGLGITLMIDRKNTDNIPPPMK